MIENEYVQNVVKSTMRTGENYIVENGIVSTVDVGGIIYTADLSDKIDPNYKYRVNDEQYSFIKSAKNIVKPFFNSGKIIYFNASLRDDPNFNNNITRKVGEGAFNYFITTDDLRTVFMTLFPGTFHLAKADKVELRIYYHPNYDRALLADFTVYKSKLKLPYHIIFLFMTFS